jgi:L-lactate dehydrogenase complex protein LldE
MCWSALATRLSAPRLSPAAGSRRSIPDSGTRRARWRATRFSPELFQGKPQEKLAREVAAKTFEFSDFLVNELKVTDLGARFPGTVTFHDGCHGLRELGIKNQVRVLLKHVRGLILVEMGEAETCCGFGGTFSVKFPMISTSMGEVKCASICATGAEYVVSNDSSCLMQIQGMLDKQGKPVKSLHLAEVLASR